MGIEYMIKVRLPENYDPTNFLNMLPSPIDKNRRGEIYNYKIESDGFYFIDHLVNNEVASTAFRAFINEALLHSDTVEVLET